MGTLTAGGDGCRLGTLTAGSNGRGLGTLTAGGGGRRLGTLTAGGMAAAPRAGWGGGISGQVSRERSSPTRAPTATPRKAGVRPPVVLRPVQRQGWWKGKCFVSEASNQRVGGSPIQRLPPTTDNQGTRAFLDGGGGYMQRQHSRRLQSSRY